MNPITIFAFTYITVIFVDISLVMYLHNKYGYIHYFKSSLYRQLMYLVLFSSILYLILPLRYTLRYSSLTLALAILQFFLFFQIVFEGIHNPKLQSLSTILSILLIIMANFTGDNLILRVLFSVLSCLSLSLYLRKYEFLGIESLSLFYLLWFAYGFNQYMLIKFPNDFFVYWFIIILILWVCQSFVSAHYTKSTSSFIKSSVKSSVINTLNFKDMILENAPVSFILTDHTSKILYVNSSVIQMTGYHESELLGSKTRIFQSGETPITTYQAMWQTIKRGKQWQGTLKNKRKDGSTYWEDMTIIPIVNSNNIITNYLGIKFDSSKAMVERSILENHAHYDDLTGTLRRRRFNELMNETMQFKRNSPFYIVMIDIDKFKQINDTFGHATGDQVLRVITEKISNAYSSKNSFLSRIGGDEFVIFTYGIKKEDVYQGAELIRENVNQINQMEAFKNIDISVSIGISKVRSDLEHALKKADTMMYSNKGRKINNK